MDICLLVKKLLKLRWTSALLLFALAFGQLTLFQSHYIVSKAVVPDQTTDVCASLSSDNCLSVPNANLQFIPPTSLIVVWIEILSVSLIVIKQKIARFLLILVWFRQLANLTRCIASTQVSQERFSSASLVGSVWLSNFSFWCSLCDCPLLLPFCSLLPRLMVKSL